MNFSYTEHEGGIWIDAEIEGIDEAALVRYLMAAVKDEMSELPTGERVTWFGLRPARSGMLTSLITLTSTGSGQSGWPVFLSDFDNGSSPLIAWVYQFPPWNATIWC